MPSAWVASMKYYSSCFSDKTCTRGSSAQGSGIENRLSVIVTADATEACLDGSGTLAYASACQYDDNDRPTFAHVNFCPSSIINDDSISVQRSTAIHELAHALGFSSETWPRMRQSDGVTRRTPLDRGEYTCIDGNTRSDFLAPADTVIQRMTLRSRPVNAACDTHGRSRSANRMAVKALLVRSWRISRRPPTLVCHRTGKSARSSTKS